MKSKKKKMRELSTNDFIEKSKKIHGNKYNYSKSIYVNNLTKVKIICQEHGEFEQTPHHHKRGGGCINCKKGAPALKLSEFIKKAVSIHENKYDYSFVEYKNNRTKVKVICPEHGAFEQRPSAHMLGQGCPKCNKGAVDILETLNRINEVHKNIYEYDFHNYKGICEKISIKCKIHGWFEQTAVSHISGSGCPKCGGRQKLTIKEFIEKSNLKHENKYDYSLVEYKNNKSKIEIICSNHGIFKQSPNSHLAGQGCPSCKLSKGELQIEKILTENKLEFIRQHKFDDCKNKRPLPFDFYLPNKNVCIEFNGRQHYEPVTAFGGEYAFKEVIKNDEIKKNYCKENMINLLTIKYTDNVLDKINFII